MGRIILPPSALSIKSRQVFDLDLTGLVTSVDLTISSVDMNKTLVMPHGYYINSGDVEYSRRCAKLELTSATNLQINKQTAFTVNNPNIVNRMQGEIVEFSDGVLRQNVQRGVYVATGNGVGGFIDTGAIFTAVSDKAIFSYLGVSTTDTGSGNSIIQMTCRLNNARNGIYFCTAPYTNTQTYRIGWEVADFI